MKILIIGSGLIGCSVAQWIIQNVPGAKLTIATKSDGEIQKLDFNGVKTPFSSSAFGGLGELWHGVADLSYLRAQGHSLDSFGVESKIFSPTDFYEFVPFKVQRPRLFRSESVAYKFDLFSINPLHTTVKAKFKSGDIDYFDKVFVCHGVYPQNDVLVASGLAEYGNSSGDHLIFSTRSTEQTKPFNIKYNRHGTIRRYSEVHTDIGTVKKTQRPVYFARNGFNHFEKAIYLSSNPKLKLLKLLKPSLVMQALNLRYGFPDFIGRVNSFYQVAVNDLYNFESNRLTLNMNAVLTVQNSIEEATGRELTSPVSGIHLANSYSRIDERLLAFRGSNENKLVYLFGSQYKFRLTHNHFTYHLIFEAIETLRKLHW